MVRYADTEMTDVKEEFHTHDPWRQGWQHTMPGHMGRRQGGPGAEGAEESVCLRAYIGDFMGRNGQGGVVGRLKRFRIGCRDGP